MIDIQADYLEIIRGILAQHAPGVEARVFGSRVDGTAAKYSDVDIAIMGREKLSLDVRAALRTAFEESDLPFRVDIIDWHSVSDEFKKKIELRYEIISA